MGIASCKAQKVRSKERQCLEGTRCSCMQVVIKLAEADVSVSALSALRFGIAALCFLPAALRGLRAPELRGTALELGLWLFGEHMPPCKHRRRCHCICCQRNMSPGNHIWSRNA